MPHLTPSDLLTLEAYSEQRAAFRERVLERAMHMLADRARRWGAFGEARLDVAALRDDERDSALRLLADTLVRLGGSAYRPRFRALSALMEQALSMAGFAATLAGCAIRRDARGAILVCREPAACQRAVPLAVGGTTWDGRWRVTVEGA